MIAYHAIFSTYGFWLPNDPRGSGSIYVASRPLYQAAGKATKTHAKRSVAAKPHSRQRRAAGKAALARPPVSFDGSQARAIGRGFAEAVRMSGHRVFACAILPEHVHVVIAESELCPRRVVGHLKRQATLALSSEQRHPFQSELSAAEPLPTCWGGKGRIVFLDTVDAVWRTIRYVEENPIKEGKPRQQWSFVVPFAG